MTIARIALALTRLLLAAALVAIAAPCAFSQPTAAPAPDAKPLAFDAISIKPNQGGSNLAGQTVNGEAVVSLRIMIRTPPDGYSASNITAKSLIATAYGIKDDLISGGPDWVGSTGYDIEAKVASFDADAPHQLTRTQRNQMLQSLLTDRFQLTTHNETKEAPIYQLVVAKGGLKLHEATPGDTYPNGPKGPDGVSHPGMMMFRPDGLTAQAIPITALLDMLSRQLHRPVVDKTGLTGKYDIALHFTPDNGPAADSPDSSGPSIFTALEEQLGLKLESTKGPVQTLVIDHIEKPSEN